VVDRRARCSGEGDEKLLILRGEVAALPLGEVEVAERLLPHADGHAEERRHRRMPLREPDRAWIGGDVREADRLLLLDESAQHTVPLRKVPDDGDELVGHSYMDELLEETIWTDHTHRAVLGTNEVDGGLDNRAQHRGEIDLACDRSAGLQQVAEPALGREHAVGRIHELGERSIEFRPWPIREGEAPGVVTQRGLPRLFSAFCGPWDLWH
jgi:hypothetical protein